MDACEAAGDGRWGGWGGEQRRPGICDAAWDDGGTRRKQSDTLIYADGADGPDVAALGGSKRQRKGGNLKGNIFVFLFLLSFRASSLESHPRSRELSNITAASARRWK